MYSLKINFEQGTNDPVVLKKVKEGQSLLEVLLKNNIAIQHLCGGACTCTTCHILIHAGEAYLEEKSKRESDFLNKVIRKTTQSRLACQCLLISGEGEVEITIPD